MRADWAYIGCPALSIRSSGCLRHSCPLHRGPRRRCGSRNLSPLLPGTSLAPHMHRAQFHVPGPGPYALTHSVGCLPKRCAAALEKTFFEPWRLTGGDAWTDWLAAIEGFRESLAALLGGSAA